MALSRVRRQLPFRFGIEDGNDPQQYTISELKEAQGAGLLKAIPLK